MIPAGSSGRIIRTRARIGRVTVDRDRAASTTKGRVAMAMGHALKRRVMMVATPDRATMGLGMMDRARKGNAKMANAAKARTVRTMARVARVARAPVATRVRRPRSAFDESGATRVRFVLRV